MKPIEIKMKQTKICKSCVRFDAVNEEQGKQVVGNVYLGNQSFEALGKPTEITVSVK